MCDICGKYICPPACPSYSGDSAEFGRCVGVCRKCGRSIYADNEYFGSVSARICLDCAKENATVFLISEADIEV